MLCGVCCDDGTSRPAQRSMASAASNELYIPALASERSPDAHDAWPPEPGSYPPSSAALLHVAFERHERKVIQQFADVASAHGRIELALAALADSQQTLLSSLRAAGLEHLHWHQSGSREGPLVDDSRNLDTKGSPGLSESVRLRHRTCEGHAERGSRHTRVLKAHIEDRSSQCPRTTSTVSTLKTGPSNIDAFVSAFLPLGWPSVLQRRLQYDEGIGIDLSQSKAKTSMRPGMFDDVNDSDSRTGRRAQQWCDLFRCSNFLIHPNSKFHMVYSTMSLFILLFDLTSLPVLIAWDMPLEGFWGISSWATPCFWTVDILINFLTGFYKEGELIITFSGISTHYIRSWFFPDIVVVVSDWTSMLVGVGMGDSVKMLRFTKLGRLLRMVGMMRMLRIIRIVEEMAENKMSEGSRLAFRMINFFAFIMLVAHFLSCAWFFIGTAGPSVSDTGAHWINFASVPLGDEVLDFVDAGTSYQYAVSLHWAVGQIALGAIDTYPRNTLERLVFVLSTMVGFLFGSTLISSLSAAMIDFQMAKKDRLVKMRTLRRYLRENLVSQQMAVAVTKQVEQRLSKPERLNEGEVPALGCLSGTLRMLLKFETTRPHLLSSPVFRLWVGLDLQCMQRVCTEAVQALRPRPRDELFVAGDACSLTYSVAVGTLSYTPEYLGGEHESLAVDRGTRSGASSQPEHSEKPETVGASSWVSEAAMWVDWTHVGTLEAMTDCLVLTIDITQLPTSLSMSRALASIAREYCKQFHARVVLAKPPHANYPTDIEVPLTSYEDLVVSMPQALQVAIGLQAVKTLSSQALLGTAGADKLREEVVSSRSVVVITGSGTVFRVVSLVAFRLSRGGDDCIFMQLGKAIGNGFVPSFQLPGSKLERGETYQDALERMFDTKLAGLVGKEQAANVGRDREIVEKESREFVVCTRYIRNVCSARFTGDRIEAPSCTVDAFSEAARQAETNPQLRALLELPVWVSSDVNKELYAWVGRDEVALLSGSAGDAMLTLWLSALKTPEKGKEYDDDKSDFEI